MHVLLEAKPIQSLDRDAYKMEVAEPHSVLFARKSVTKLTAEEIKNKIMAEYDAGHCKVSQHFQRIELDDNSNITVTEVLV